MNVVAHNLLAMNEVRHYGINKKSMNKSTEKLSTGYKINRSADDAAGLSISEKMRNQIRNLNQAVKNVEDGTALIKVADGALQRIHDMIGRQRELLVKAANDIYTPDDTQAMEDEIGEIEQAIDEIFDKTQFNGRYIFKGKDTIVSGPDVVDNSRSYTVGPNTTSSVVGTEIIWSDTTPANTKTVVGNKTTVHQESSLVEREELNSPNEGYPMYDEIEEYNHTKVTDSTKTELEITYEKIPADSDYTKLVKPGTMVGSNGYINVQNVAGNLSLSCAMSQLGVKVDGTVLSVDLYGSGYPKTTTTSPDGNKAETTFDLQNGIKLTQTIELQGGNTYGISYKVQDTSGTPHDVDVRLAFDVLNTPVTGGKSSGSSGYTLATDLASVNISASGATNSAIGNINDLYNNWDDSKITTGAAAGNHAGVGYWWSADTTGGSASLGSVSYGPITLLKEPYKKTTVQIEESKQDVDLTSTKTTTTILPEYLNIQDGANAGERTVLRMYELSVDKLKYKTGTDISAYDAATSLNTADRVSMKISSIRSVYGAIQNRLERTYNSNTNYSENLQTAESSIRDTDMATEMANRSKQSILMQATQAMMSQTNSNSQSVLSLLQQ